MFLNNCKLQCTLISARLAAGLVILVLLFGCSADEKEQPGKTDEQAQHEVSVSGTLEKPVVISITADKAHEMLSNRKDILFVDVRTAEEVEEAAVEGAEHIPMGRILLGHSVLPKDRAILLVCAVGGRSYGVGRYLAQKGYPEVYNLRGGIAAWEKTGLPVIKNNQNQKK